MAHDLTRNAGGANLPQPVPSVVPIVPRVPLPPAPDLPPAEISDPPLPGHFPLLGGNLTLCH